MTTLKTRSIVSERRRCVAGAALALLLALGGCASSELSVGRSLAKAGVDTAATLESTAARTADQFAETRRLDVLQIALETGTPTPNQVPPDLFSKVHEQLGARQALAGELVSAYATFAKLANYDASQEMENALNGAIEAYNGYAGSVGAAGLPAMQGEILRIGGGLIADQILLNKLKAASKTLRELLENYAALMEKEQQATIAILQDQSRHLFNLTRDLWTAKVVSAKPVLQGIVTRTGYVLADDKAGDFTAGNRQLDAAIRAELALRRDDTDRAIPGAYQETIKVVKALAGEHRSFEGGKSVDLDGVLALAQRLARIVDRIDQASKPKGGSK